MNRSVASTLLIAAMCGGPALAEGQTPSTPAVFKGAETRDAQNGGLDVLVDLLQAYDDDVLSDQGNGAPNRPRVASSVGGLYSGLGLAARYGAIGEDAHLESWANSTLRYYPDLKNLTAARHQAGVALSHSLGRHFTLRVSPLATYSPHYAMRLMPGSDPDPDAQMSDPTVVSTPDGDHALVRGSSYRYGGTAGVHVSLSPLSTLELKYGYSKAVFDDRVANLEVQTSGVTYGRRVTRYASLRVGYSRQEGDYQASDRALVESINLGLDYRKPLSRSRRTFLRFSSGSAIADGGSGRRIQALGSASLAHQIGRTWIAQVEFRRGIRHVEGFDRPLSSDSVSTTAKGLLTRRLELSFAANYLAGTVGLSGGSPAVDSYAASGSVRTALSRTLAAYVEYLFYHYRFDEGAVRPLGVPESFNRRGARIGLVLFVPVIE